jgi:transposase
MELKRLGMDRSKHVFTLHGIDAEDRVVQRRESRRSQVEAFFAALAPTEVALEACGASHHGGLLQRLSRSHTAGISRVREDARTECPERFPLMWKPLLGHRVRLIPAQYVKPCVKRGKNDRIDAEAIANPIGASGMRRTERPEPKATPGGRYT